MRTWQGNKGQVVTLFGLRRYGDPKFLVTMGTASSSRDTGESVI